MARPVKLGLSYFPQDTNIHSDRKIRRLLTEHGANGYLVYDYIKCLIYSDKGYYINIDDDLIFDIAYFLQCGITIEIINSIIQFCLNQNLFNKILFENHPILTSSGIQKRYLSAKRDSSICKKYEVITDETGVITVITPVITDEIPTKPPFIPKVKERKVKEIEKNNNSKELLLEKHKIENGQDYILSFEKFEKWIEENTPFVATMKHPISFEDFLKIRGLIPINGKKTIIPSEDVRTFLMNIQNNKVYQKKYTSPFLCINLWYKNKNIQK